jgi:hypothetical protein
MTPPDIGLRASWNGSASPLTAISRSSSSSTEIGGRSASRPVCSRAHAPPSRKSPSAAAAFHESRCRIAISRRRSSFTRPWPRREPSVSGGDHRARAGTVSELTSRGTRPSRPIERGPRRFRIEASSPLPEKPRIFPGTLQRLPNRCGRS